MTDLRGRSARPSRKVADDIIEQLRRDITTGRLAQWSRLPAERELAEQFGVSQPTIREVVRVLDTMGLVDVRHGNGTFVRGDGSAFLHAGLESILQLEQVGLLDALDVRAVLGLSSASLAASRATETDLAELERSYERLDRISQLVTIEELIDAIAGLQIAVAAAAHNPLQVTVERILIELLLNLQIRAMRPRGLRSWQRRAAEFQPDRRAIIDAITARDPEAARTAMDRYLQHQRALFESDKDLASLRLDDPRAVQVASDLRLASGRRQIAE